MSDATPEPNTFIWSGEHRAYWRPNAYGYTTEVERAGIWHYAEAERMTKHCGPEKQIQLRLKHETPELILAAERKEAAAIALWNHFGDPHQREWSAEPRKTDFYVAVDDIVAALNGTQVLR